MSNRVPVLCQTTYPDRSLPFAINRVEYVMSETPPRPLIEARDVEKRYGDQVILRGVTLDVLPGETVAMIGPSGGGKSTFLRCLNGLTTFDAGLVRVGDETIPPGAATSNHTAIHARVRRFVGMVFQDFQLFPHLTALGNVAEAPRTVLGLPAREAEGQARDILAKVGLSDRCLHFPAQLSGGQKQRVAIARALAMRPRALLCDEVTSALDPEVKHEVLAVLEALRGEGLSIVMVTHEIGFARRAADRVFVLADGRVVESGSAREVVDHPQVERTQRFLRSVLG